MLPKQVLAGRKEKIFEVLPQSILSNMLHPRSENALVWNLLYPLAHPRISLEAMLQIPPLWGTAKLEKADEEVTPYFWGYSIPGKRMPGLDQTLLAIDGPGNKTEVDIFLMGDRSLVVVEAKHLGRFGRCSRFARGRCPEIQSLDREADASCRYWADSQARFELFLDFGPRPNMQGDSPVCNRHYQLARTLMVAKGLSKRLGLAPHIWLITPRDEWPPLERLWLDFVERIRDDALWRRSRVLAWEDIRNLARPRHSGSFPAKKV